MGLSWFSDDGRLGWYVGAGGAMAVRDGILSPTQPVKWPSSSPPSFGWVTAVAVRPDGHEGWAFGNRDPGGDLQEFVLRLSDDVWQFDQAASAIFNRKDSPSGGVFSAWINRDGTEAWAFRSKAWRWNGSAWTLGSGAPALGSRTTLRIGDDGANGWGCGLGIWRLREGAWSHPSPPLATVRESCAFDRSGTHGWAVGPSGALRLSDGNWSADPSAAALKDQDATLAMNSDLTRGWAIGAAGATRLSEHPAHRLGAQPARHRGVSLERAWPPWSETRPPGSPLLNKTGAALEQDAGYQSATAVIDDCLQLIEQTVLSGSPSEVEQRRGCLELLRRRAKRQDQRRDAGEIMNELLEQRVVSKWQSTDEKTKYQRGAEIILIWKEYFLSYTRRGAARLNDRYRRFVKDAYLEPRPADDEWRRENLVAQAIDRRLAREQLSGHFDRSSLRDGQKIDPAIHAELRASAVFVQLLHQDSLLLPGPAERNWCFDEFKAFLTADQGRGERLTVLVDADNIEALKPAGLDEAYRDEWLNLIKEGLYQALTAIPAKPDGIDRWFRARALEIRKRKEELIDAAIDQA